MSEWLLAICEDIVTGNWHYRVDIKGAQPFPRESGAGWWQDEASVWLSTAGVRALIFLKWIFTAGWVTAREEISGTYRKVSQTEKAVEENWGGTG